MGNSANKATEFAEKVQDDASDFVQRLAGEANAFAVMIDLISTAPSKPLAMPSEELRQAAEQIYERIDFGQLNIGIIGGPGTGKLSLINALLQQPRNSHVSIANEDEVKVAKQFIDPTFNHIRFWYLPDDYGEDDIPAANYFFERCLFAFDIILILVHNKIRLGDIELAKQAYVTDPSTPVAFLRSKIDGTLIAQVGRVANVQQWDLEKDKIANRIRSSLRKQLDQANLHDASIFLVSQAGILDVNGKEPNDHRYVVDDYQFYNYLAQTFQEKRYSDSVSE